MKICVVGLGYVGAVTSACLARDGHDVLGIDLDQTKLELIRSGRSPVVEDEISEITDAAVKSGKLTVHHEISRALEWYDLIFICVGTPSLPNGDQDLTAVRNVVREIAQSLPSKSGFPVVVLRSTVGPGITETVVKQVLEEHSGRRVGDSIGLAFQPEFLREGSSVRDFYNPPYTVVGSSCRRSTDSVSALFQGFSGEFIVTTFREAEMLKLTCNTFHALKVTFANEVGRICRATGMDARVVMDLVCKDTQLNISPAYLKPGFAFGGSCLPKDLKAVLRLANSCDVDTPLMQGVLRSNELHIQSATDLILKCGSRNIGIIGLSFKQGTDDLRESPMVTLAETLIGKGFNLMIFDPAVSVARLMGANLKYINSTIPHIESLLVSRIEDVVEHGEVLVLGQKAEGLERLVGARTGGLPRIVDLIGIRGIEKSTKDYQGICW